MPLVKTDIPGTDFPLETLVEVLPGLNTSARFKIAVERTAAANAQINLIPVPANTRITRITVRCKSAGTITTGTLFDIGYGADLDAIGSLAFTSIDAAGDVWNPVITTPHYVSSGTTIHVNAAAADHSAAGNLTTGTWTFLFEYEILPTLA